MAKKHIFKVGTDALPESFWANVAINVNTGCWVWTGYKDKDGYAIFHSNYYRDKKKTKRAARIAYMAFRGDIPEGMTIQHDCYNKACVSPVKGHAWRLLTSADNVRHAKARIDHCPYGHKYTEENTFRFPSNPARQCRECFRQRSKKFGDERRKKEGRQWGVTYKGVLQSGRCRNGHGRDVIIRLADGAYHCEECGGWP